MLYGKRLFILYLYYLLVFGSDKEHSSSSSSWYMSLQVGLLLVPSSPDTHNNIRMTEPKLPLLLDMKCETSRAFFYAKKCAIRAMFLREPY